MKDKKVLLLALAALFGGASVSFADPVAQIGDETYDSLAAALTAAATSGSVIDLTEGTFDFLGGSVSGNQTKGTGAALSVAVGATLNVAGSATVAGNQPRDLNLAAGAEVMVVGPLTGTLCLTSAAGRGETFAHVADGVNPKTVAKAFQNADPGLVPEVDGTTLRWKEKSPYPEPVDEEEAVVKVLDAQGAELCYATLEDAVAATVSGPARFTLLADAVLAANLVPQVDLILDGDGHTLERTDLAPKTRIAVTNVSLTVTNLTLTGGSNRLIDVHCGDLTLDDGAVIADIAGSTSDMVAPVVVWGGTFTMNPGAAIRDCTNTYRRTNGGALAAGGVVVSSYKGLDGAVVSAKAFLNGGTVTGCTGASAGGVYIGVKSTVDVQGDLSVLGNSSLTGEPSNLVVHDLSGLALVGEVTHGLKTIGYREGIGGSASEFGRVTATGLTDDALVASARNFTHDTNGDLGAVARGNGELLLIWNAAADSDGNYVTEEGASLPLVESVEKLTVPVPAAAEGLVYTGVPQVGVQEDPAYEVTGGVETDAGSYEAVVRLRTGYVWEDGSADGKRLPWTIAKAVYDMSGVSLADKTFVSNGSTPRKLTVTGTLPVGVTVTYEGNGQVNPGEYVVTAVFTGDTVNHEPIPSLTATMTITGAIEPEPTPVVCEPFAFTAINRLEDGSWQLTLAPGTTYCVYTLLTSDDLTTWTAVGEPLTLAPDAVFEFTVEGGEAKRFWKVSGEDGVQPTGR